MSTLRFTDRTWSRIEAHLTDAPAERVAFALTRVVSDDDHDGPVLVVEDVELLADHEVERHRSGWSASPPVLDRIHERAAREGRGLVEVHGHHQGPPHFSYAEEAELITTVDLVDDLLDGRPYGAVVWADGVVRAEWFRRLGGEMQRGLFRSVAVVGRRLRLLDARWVDEGRFHRQVPLLGRAGQAALRRLRVAVVGSGGTGSHAVTQLAYLGVRDLLLLDGDVVDATSLNRMVTAEPPDLGAPKTLVTGRRVLALDHDATVRSRPALGPGAGHGEVTEADLILGCVDHDGPRHRLNRLALDAGVPYVDIGTGVDAGADPPAMGARVAFVVPGGPCLTCTAELDPAEVARWYAGPAGAAGVGDGYGEGTTASVVHLNGLAVSTALAEVAAWIAGTRPPALRLDVDVNGAPGFPGIRVSPSADRDRRLDCPDCGGSI